MGLSCSECGRDFKSQSALTQHLNRDHTADPVAALRASIPGAPRPGGTFDSRPLKAAPCGIPSVDYAMGIGGVPRGCLAEVFGPPHSGKTFMALTFAAYEQQRGGRAGFMDAERAINERFLALVPGLDPDALEYGIPPDAFEEADEKRRAKMLDEGWDGSGESALEASRRWIKTGQFGVWIVDSVHALAPREALNKPLGDKQTRAAQAIMMGEACKVLDHEIARTNTLMVFVNHVKAIPGQTFGRDWSKPGGSALDYYASMQLHVTMGPSYYRKGDNRRIGHQVKIRVHKNKVAMPFAKTDFDLFYGAGAVEIDKKLRTAMPGVDLASSWFSVLKEADAIEYRGNAWVDKQSGEKYGTEMECREALSDPTSNLAVEARKIVYPEQYVSA